MNQQFSAVLMAGGASRRMGRDKRVIELDGVPLWRRQFNLLASLHPADLMISGPVDGPWAGEQIQVLEDHQTEAGPLAGLCAALSAAAHPMVLVLAVDLPSMPAEFLSRMLACSEQSGQGLIPQRGDNFEPLAAIYPRECAVIARDALNQGAFALHDFVHSVLAAKRARPLKIAESETPYFLNLNRPSDLAMFANIQSTTA